MNSYLSVEPYFEKMRSLSYSGPSAGHGVGAIYIPQLLRYLFNTWDFSGALLLFGMR